MNNLASNMEENYKSKREDLKECASNVKDRPLTAMLIAGAVGYLGATFLRH